MEDVRALPWQFKRNMRGEQLDIVDVKISDLNKLSYIHYYARK